MEDLVEIFGSLSDDEVLTPDKEFNPNRKGNQEKKAAMYERVKLKRNAKRAEEHRIRRVKLKARPYIEPTPINLKVIFDLSFNAFMTKRERSSLVRQFCGVRSVEKRFSGLQISLNCHDADELLEECREKINGFDNFGWDLMDTIINETCDLPIVFLSPDATNPPLTTIDRNKFYVIGGLIDKSGAGPQTLKKAEALDVQVFRLPIAEYGRRAEIGTWNSMLTVNQVFEILCLYCSTNSWPEALSRAVPKRIGYLFD